MTSWVPFDLLDHLWQSTLFTAAVWLVARAVRSNAARVRYWLWFAASLKFLVPVSVLVAIGERFAWRTTPVAPPPVVSFVIEQVWTPAAVTAATAPAVAATSSTLAWSLLIAAWGCGVVLVLAQWWRQWQPVRRALRDARAIDIGQHAGLTVLTSPSMIEPGVFGIRRPVLLVPEGISDRLTPAQLRALIAHEQCHVRHHDNLTAALHMAVEALFWFHPLVWWLERRLIDERERACDEYVLQSGSTPRDYAEGILEVCRFAKEPAPVFVAGVTGSDLRRRIELILRNQSARPLGLERAVALLVCAAVAVLGPMTVGAVQSTKPAQAAPDNRPRFDVVSIKRNMSGSQDLAINVPNGTTYNVGNTPMRGTIMRAYQVKNLAGVPPWVDEERYDIVAKSPGKPNVDEVSAMLRTMLKDRLTLAGHIEPREIPVYALTVARPGHPGLKPVALDCDAVRAARDAAVKTGQNSVSAAANGATPCAYTWMGTTIASGGIPMPMFAGLLDYVAGRVVVDRTNLTGRYEFAVRFTPPGMPTGVRPDDPPDFFTAIQEQLGLRLEATRAPVDTFVIDHIERPTEN